MGSGGTSGGSPFNINTAIALFTIVGSFFLLSEKLGTDRSTVPPRGTGTALGDQVLEARLWEDPLSPRRSSVTNQNLTLVDLRNQITNEYRNGNKIIILPVMVAGGSFGEDQETRIRSRFAIVNALGQSGYVPKEEEYIGEVRQDWPSTAELEAAKTTGKLFLERLKQGREPRDEHVPSGILTNTGRSDRLFDFAGLIRTGREVQELTDDQPQENAGKVGTRILTLRYEWYRPRQFYKAAGSIAGTRVLLLWLAEGNFADDPLYRLASLLDPLIEPIRNPSLAGEGMAPVRLIGPRSSSTLRAMLPTVLSAREALSETQPETWCAVTNVLRHVSLYCPTASAMDEVLVPEAVPGQPRMPVIQALEGKVFRTAKFFAATDSQLAAEIMDELKLRKIDPRDPKHHIVVISDWDTFYGRMLTLTYGAALRSYGGTGGSFAEMFRQGREEFPPNYHYFTFLRGMDGQSLEEGGSGDKEKDSEKKPRTLTEIAQWRPDVNKAEGRAQFDYLGRLADRISDLEQNIAADGNGEITAIGIVGSDIYDVLLVLQALRPRFPNARFFTTELDARLLSPREREWAQNLIVSSSYGFQLHPNLQGSVAPFRDSLQTAQFAATLAAMGNETLSSAPKVQPRRFEIGRYRVADLSTNGSGNIHPERDWEQTGISIFHVRRIIWLGVAGLAAGALLLGFVPAFQKAALNRERQQAELSLYDEIDLGGSDGVRRILIALENWKDEKLVSWFVREFRNEREEMGIHVPRLKAAYHINAPLEMIEWLKMSDRELSKWEEQFVTSPTQYVDDVVQAFCRLLNMIVRGVITPLDSDLKYTELLTEEEKTKFKQCREQQKLDDPTGSHFNAARMGQRRELMDKALKALSRRIASGFPREGETKPGIYFSERASKSARFAGMEIFKLKLLGNNFLLGFAMAGSALLIGFVLIAWSETYRNPTGEPFSISSGISAWPTEALRLAAFFFSGAFLFRGFYLVRKTILRLTRKYRFAFGEQGDEKVFTESPQFRWFTRPVSVSSKFVERDAEKIWANYQKYTSFRNTFQRSLVGIGFFLIFGFCLMYFSGFPARPIRGNILGFYDKWILVFSVAGFLALAFWTIEICRSTQWFVEQLTDGPTVYPVPTRQYFSAERGNIHHDYLDEWIDIQLIADVTEAVGKLIYFPFVIFFLLLLARNQWWDNWGWTNGLIIIFLCNLALAAASILILQRSARQAKVEAEASLAAKVARSQAVAAPSPAANDAFQAERLLNDMRSIRRGAFVPFWENPLLAAILLPSGGTVLLELLLVFMNR